MILFKITSHIVVNVSNKCYLLSTNVVPTYYLYAMFKSSKQNFINIYYLFICTLLRLTYN